jgi:hypothetical protein
VHKLDQRRALLFVVCLNIAGTTCATFSTTGSYIQKALPSFKMSPTILLTCHMQFNILRHNSQLVLLLITILNSVLHSRSLFCVFECYRVSIYRIHNLTVASPLLAAHFNVAEQGLVTVTSYFQKQLSNCLIPLPYFHHFLHLPRPIPTPAHLPGAAVLCQIAVHSHGS